MKYKIALQQRDEGFSVSVPGRPGCWSQGDTEKEALKNIEVAIREYLAARDELLEDATVREMWRPEGTEDRGRQPPSSRSSAPEGWVQGAP